MFRSLQRNQPGQSKVVNALRDGQKKAITVQF